MMRPLLVVTLVAGLAAQPQVGDADVARAGAAVREAFEFLYALPSDTAGAAMGSWVVDSGATTPAADRSGHWKLVVTQLSDTGNGLKLSEMIGSGGTSPAQLAAAMEAMQKLESKISKSEAEASIEINVTLNPNELSAAGVSDGAPRTSPSIAGTSLVVRVKGDWMRLDDRELDIDLERWSPATLLVGFGDFSPLTTARLRATESQSTFTALARPGVASRAIHNVAVTVQGNEEMLERVVKETKWDALARLLSP